MKKRYKALLSISLILTVLSLVLGFQKYSYPDKSEIELKVNYLERILTLPLSDSSDISTIETENSEWSLFSLSFSSFALTNITIRDSTFKNKSILLIDSAIQKALIETIYSTYFYNQHPIHPSIDTTASVLYFGHLNMMLGCYRLLSQDSKYDELNDKISQSLNKRFYQSKFMCLESYPSQIWVADNTVALASLKLHSKNTGKKYSIFKDWIGYAKKYFLDKETGLLCSTINSQTGKQTEEPRGAMLGWSIFFMHRFDKEFAKQQYQQYKDKFSDNMFVFRLFKERYQDRKTDMYGDIDSGPIIWGYSIPANAFAFADAVAMDDLYTAKRLHRLIKFGSQELHQNNEITYKTRFVEVKTRPLAEALLLYFETITSWEDY
jgi:hypothetical protein